MRNELVADTRKTVLVVEDDEDIAESIRYNLEREGAYRVSVARTGEEGLRLAMEKGRGEEPIIARGA